MAPTAPVHSDCKHTLLLVDGALDVEGDAQDDNVAGDVEGAADVEHVRVIEGYLLRDLHHPEDDDQVRSGPRTTLAPWRGSLVASSRDRVSLHLGAESGHCSYVTSDVGVARGVDCRSVGGCPVTCTTALRVGGSGGGAQSREILLSAEDVPTTGHDQTRNLMRQLEVQCATGAAPLPPNPCLACRAPALLLFRPWLAWPRGPRLPAGMLTGSAPMLTGSAPVKGLLGRAAGPCRLHEEATFA